LSTVIDKAIEAGKFSEARRAHWEAALARDPQRTTQVIEAMTAVPDLSKLPATSRRQRSAPITSSAGLPLVPHPMGGYVVDRSQAS
jgi:hypothetical protein